MKLEDDGEGLSVYYWPAKNMILVAGFDNIPNLFEAPNLTRPDDPRKWLWTKINLSSLKELVKIGEL